MNQKTNKYTSGELEERKTPKIGDSSNNDKGVLRKFRKNHKKMPVLESLS